MTEPGGASCQTVVFRGVPVLVRGRGPITADARAALEELLDVLVAKQKVAYLLPARPQRAVTLAKAWAWGALGLPCRDRATVARCGTCPPCEARAEAVRAWCP